MTKKVALSVLAVTATAAAVLALAMKPAPAVETLAGENSSGHALVAAAGLVEPRSEEIRLSSQINGKIRDIRVEEGDRIHRGQIVAVIDNADFQARVAIAEALVAQKQAQQMRVRNGSRSEERRESSAAVAEAKAILDETRAEFQRRENLFRSGDIAKAALDKAEREMAVAQARYGAAWERRGIVEQVSREEDILSANADVEQAKAQLAEARALLEKTYIRAPIDGTVLRRRAKAGESVSTGNPEAWIVSLGDNSALRVRVDVDEADVARVQVGQPAYVTAEAYGRQRFTGRVVRVGQILGRKNIRTDEPTERIDTKILETLVELDPGQKLPAGLRVDAYLQASAR